MSSNPSRLLSGVFTARPPTKTAVLTAANLGEDADTTAAICGQIAAALYGVGEIPTKWLQLLARRELIEGLADRLEGGLKR